MKSHIWTQIPWASLVNPWELESFKNKKSVSKHPKIQKNNLLIPQQEMTINMTSSNPTTMAMASKLPFHDSPFDNTAGMAQLAFIFQGRGLARQDVQKRIGDLQKTDDVQRSAWTSPTYWLQNLWILFLSGIETFKNWDTRNQQKNQSEQPASYKYPVWCSILILFGVPVKCLREKIGSDFRPWWSSQHEIRNPSSRYCRTDQNWPNMRIPAFQFFLWKITIPSLGLIQMILT